MQVSVETLGSIGRRVTVSVPAEQLEKEVAAKLRQLTKNARLPGFRPGKAPIKVVENRYGKDVLNEVAGNLIDSSLRQALTQENLIPAAGPNVEPTRLVRGEDLEYVASFDVFPEIKQLDIDGIRIERPAYEIKDSDIDATLDTMRKQRLTWQPVDRTSRNKDRVLIDFEGTVDGEPFPGGKAEKFAVVLGPRITMVRRLQVSLLRLMLQYVKSVNRFYPTSMRSWPGHSASRMAMCKNCAARCETMSSGRWRTAFAASSGSGFSTR